MPATPDVMPAGSTGAQRHHVSRVVLLLGSLAAVVACGARAMVSDEGGDALDGAAGAAGAPASAGAGGSRPTFVTPDEPDDRPCARPFLRSRAADRACPFVVEGFCHQDEGCACDAACEQGEQCVISGFLNDEEPQRVSCVELR